MKWAQKMRSRRLNVLFLLVAALVFTACGARQVTNWPGLSAEGDVVYIAGGPQVYAVDIAQQKQVWVYPKESGKVQFLAAPVIDGDQVIFGDFGLKEGTFKPKPLVSVYNLQNSSNTATPAENWTISGIADDRIVAPVGLSDDQIFVGSADNYIVALNRANGDEMWRHQLDHGVWGAPSYAEGIVVVGSMDRSVHAYDAQSGTLQWEVIFGGAIPMTPIIVDGFVYVGGFDSQIHALNLQDGGEKWVASAEGWIWSAPAVSDTQVVFADDQGNVFAVNRSDGTQQWVQQVTGTVLGSPVMTPQGVAVASQGSVEAETGELTLLSAETGTIIWQQATPTPLQTTPVFVDNALVVIIANDDALINIYDIDSGVRRWSFLPEDK